MTFHQACRQLHLTTTGPLIKGHSHYSSNGNTVPTRREDRDVAAFSRLPANRLGGGVRCGRRPLPKGGY